MLLNLAVEVFSLPPQKNLISFPDICVRVFVLFCLQDMFSFFFFFYILLLCFTKLKKVKWSPSPPMSLQLEQIVLSAQSAGSERTGLDTSSSPTETAVPEWKTDRLMGSSALVHLSKGAIRTLQKRISLSEAVQNTTPSESLAPLTKNLSHLPTAVPDSTMSVGCTWGQI